jgi:integrase
VRVSLGRDPETGKYRTLAREVHGGRRDAEKAAARLLTEIADGHAVAARGSVADLLKRWLEHQESRGLAPRTLHGYRKFSKRISADLGRIQLRKLTAADLDRFYGLLVSEGMSPKSVQLHHGTIRAALRQAKKWGLIMFSPADNASPPKVSFVEPQVPTPAEVRALVKAVWESNPDLATFVFVAATTGLRRGELCGLQWLDVDLDRLDLVVRRAVSSVPGEPLSIRSTKTGRVRRLALDPGTASVLDRHRARCRERCEAVGAVLGPTSYVFSRAVDSSEPSAPDGWTQAFVRLRDRLGLRHVKLHHLRHYAATTALAGGVDVRTVAGRLGHSQPTLTLRTYAHVVEAADRSAANVIGSTLLVDDDPTSSG